MALNRVSRSWLTCLLLSSVVVAVPLSAGDPLFPRPIHLTRKIVDPLAPGPVVVEEYCEGNRVVTVSGTTTIIVDYARQELTEIDRSGGTFSITPFSAIARQAAAGPRGTGESSFARLDREVRTVSHGQKVSASGRRVDSFEITGARMPDRRVWVDVDRTVEISRDALDVLLGAAYPGTAAREHEALVAAAGDGANGRIKGDGDAQTGAERYGLPVEQRIEIGAEGTTLRWTTSVVRIGNESAPAALLAIPSGARQVESRTSATRRALEDLDRLPSPRER